MENFIETDCDLSFLNGCTIKQVGFLAKFEGGLTIDYIDLNKKEKRLILGYNELGTWIESNIGSNENEHNELKEIATGMFKVFKELETFQLKNNSYIFDGISFKKNKWSIILENEENHPVSLWTQINKKDIDVLCSITPNWTWVNINNLSDFHLFYIDLETYFGKLFRDYYCSLFTTVNGKAHDL